MECGDVYFNRIVWLRTLSNGRVKGKGEAVNKIHRDTNLSNIVHKIKKQALSVTLIDGLSRNCRQTGTLQFLGM